MKISKGKMKMLGFGVTAVVLLVPLATAGPLPGITIGPGQGEHGEGCVNILPQIDAGTGIGWPRSLLWDYGDAPDSTKIGMTTFYTPPGSPIGFFPTIAPTAFSAFGTPGARHKIVEIGWLGNISAYGPTPNPAPLNVLADPFPSLEYDADTFPDQDPTTNLVGAVPDFDRFDNGLVPALLFTSTPSTVQFRVSTTSGITNWYVNILFDWNYDGMWAGFDPMNGAPEWAVVNQPVTVLPFTSQLFTSTPFLTGFNPQDPWVRITLSDTPIPMGLYPMGWDGSVPPGTFDHDGHPAFACGETEDYCGQIVLRPRSPNFEYQVFCDRKQSGPEH